MSNETQTPPEPGAAANPGTAEMPAPTVWPMVLALGLALAAAGAVTNSGILIVGVIILAVGLAGWVAQLLPGRGHFHEVLAGPLGRRPVQGALGTVEQLRPGLPGYRVRLPEHVHPISAGMKGGIAGGLAMLLPAALYGIVSGRGIWYPLNLLAGMTMPGIQSMTVEDLGRFHASLFLVGVVFHVVMSLFLGLMYGVLLPTLPDIPKPIAWGGLLMPMLWTAVSFCLMGVVNPVMHRGVDWFWFIASQFVFGVVSAVVFMRAEPQGRTRAAALGGVAGGLLMPVPAVLWSLAAGHRLWYPANLLAGMVLPGMDALPAEELKQFHAGWLAAAIVIHAVLSLSFGLAYGLVLPRLPEVPGPLSWGGMLMPLLWTAVSFSLMGVVNPVLQERVDWPWFVVSQFVFGVVAAVVVGRSQQIYIPPAGRGPDRVAAFLTGQEGPP